MRVFVTGASGWIGRGVVPELLDAGHEVIGLARSDASAARIRGAEVLRGDLDDLDVLTEGARRADAVIHLAYIHDFARFADSARADLTAIQTLGAALEGTGKPLTIASGVLGVRPGELLTEDFIPPRDLPHPRVQAARATLDLAERGVRSSIVRLAPTVHGEGDHGFVPELIRAARESGVAAYLREGLNVWPAVHRDDAATLFRLAIEKAPAGSVLHGVAERGVPTREIAETIGRHLGLPARPADKIDSFLSDFYALDAPTSNDATWRLTGWTPGKPGLIADLDEGHYFK
ncbi:SDR family oxidoreductase [Actinoplanes sp. NPDC049596]|uniref:SDR family oxidoreductase n=1 Tax=unclassified Actinoplanes TaxID=2626549 RepID=UPI00341D2B62